MGIGVQGEACGEVTQHAGYGLDVHTILERDGCEGVAEVMAEEMTWLMFRTVFADSPFGCSLDSILSTLPWVRSLQ